jgi:thiol-disulfide isomerase/thioredoxin
MYRMLTLLFAAFGAGIGWSAGVPRSLAHTPILLHFSAAGCPHCLAALPDLQQLSDAGWIIRQIDIHQERSLAQRWKIAATPTTIVLQAGQELARISGKIDPVRLNAAYRPAASRGPEPPTMAVMPVGAISDLGHRRSSLPSRPVDPMSVSVRIRIEDGSSISYGTGTIIDQHQDEALVLTCGHLFRQLGENASIAVDVPQPQGFATIPASVIDFRCDDSDIGLVAFRTEVPLPVAPLMPRGISLREGQSVCSVGCDHGADPSRRDSHITKLNRFLGPANVEVAQAPVQGRSGGGLFNESGQLIGVCYAADHELDEGLYSGPEVVYEQLERLGLRRLYESPSNPPPPTQAWEENWQQAVHQAATTLDSAPSHLVPGGATSLTLSLRDAAGSEQRFLIRNPSPELLQRLRSQALPLESIPAAIANR